MSLHLQLAAALAKEGYIRHEGIATVLPILKDRVRWPDGGGAPIIIGVHGEQRNGVTVIDLVRDLCLVYPEIVPGGRDAAAETAAAMEGRE